MKQTFKFLTLSRVFNDCRDSVGRLSTLFLLLFALSFGFSSQAWGGTNNCHIPDDNAMKVKGSWDSWIEHELTKDGTHFYGDVYIKYSSDAYEFGIESYYDNGSNFRKRSDTFSSSNEGPTYYWGCSDNQSNAKLQTISATSGYIKAQFDVWQYYGIENDTYTGAVKVHQEAVSDLSGSMNPSTTSVASGSSLNMNPSISGGSGSYNKQYSANPDIGSFDGDNYKAPMVLSNTSVTITLEVSDANGQLSGLAHKTITKTITITPPTGDLYIKHPWSTGADNAWSWQKMEKVSNGNYKFSGNYGGDGKSCDINTTNNDEGKLNISGSNLIVTNTPAANDKCWFTLSYSAGTITIAPKTYTLTLDGNGGTPTTQDVTVTYGKGCPTFTAVEKTGYTWEGFFINTTGGNAVILKSTSKFNANTTNWITNYNWTKDADATLHAQWKANTYKVQFEKNGATSGTDHQQQSFTYDADEVALTSIESLGYGKTGYHFKGWATTSDGNVVYADQQQVKNLTAKAETIKVYAIWAPDTTVITLNRNYNRDGVDSNPGEYKAVYDATFTQFAKNTDFIREGYTFTGYKADINNSGSAGIINVVSGDPITYAFPQSGTYGKSGNVWGYTGSTLTAYAYWTANLYTITLHYNDGTENTGTKIVTFDATATAVTKPSYGTNVFNGYYTQATGGVQVINADGAFVPDVDGYTSNGNWVKASDVDLYAQWTTRTPCTITYGVTDGTLAVSTRGTIKAKIGDGESSNTGSLSVYTGDQVTITYVAKKGQYYGDNNGYEAKGWYSAASGGSSLPATLKNDYTFTVTGNASVYVKADPVVYTISTAVNPASTTQYPEGAGTVTPTSGEAGPDIALQLTAAEQTGYDWVNWTLSDNTNGKIVVGDATSKTISVAAKAAGVIATANFAIHNYTITYNLDGGTNYDGAPANYTIETTTINLGTPTKTDYTFDGWFDAETGGNQVTQIALGSTGNKTLWARWHETLHIVNIVESTGIESVSPAGATNVGNVTPVTITATVRAGYTWKNWTTDHYTRITFGNANENPTTINATESTNVYANATENMTTITINANQTTWGELQIGSSADNWGSTRTAGVATDRDLTARPNTGYKFVNWTLAGGATSTSALTNATITIKGNGVANSTGTATAIFEEDLSSNWYLAGTDNIFPDGWNTSEKNMMKRATGHSTENVYYFTIHVDDKDIKSSGEESTYQFKIRHYKTGTGACDDYFGWSKGDTHYWVNKTCTTGVYTGDDNGNNLYFIPNIAGDYEFKVDATGANPELTVTFPAAQTYTVTISADANGSVEPNGEQQVDAITGISVTATPNPGYHFDSWVASDGITTTSNTATTTVKATKAGTLQATFAANTPIYFQNAIKNTWNPEHLYIYLYKDNTYWEGTGDNKQDRGTGSDKSKYDGSCIAGPIEMTHIQNTDIWEYDYDPALSFNTIVFSDQTMENYEWFTNCTAVRSTDFNSCMNMFVLNDATEEWHNPDAQDQSKKTARYFNNGFWRNYNSTTSKMSLHVWDVSTSAEAAGGNVEMVSDVPGNETFTAKVKLDGNHQYNIYLGACNSKNFSQNVTITSENCSGIQMYQYNSIDDKTQLAYLHTAASGDYTFSLTFADDKMLLSVEYPITSNDYRVKIGTPARYSNIIRSSEASGTISMFLNAGINTFTYEKATDVDVSPIVWSEDGTINVNVEKEGVYTMTLTKGETPTITNIQPYTGKYYIRTDCAPGGWNEYKTNDNNLMRFTDRNPKFVNDSTQGFNYYYCRWNANESGNVRFVVANDINACISDTMKADEWLDNNEALKGMANIRFGWNSNTNVLSRAYISGSYDAETYLRILSNDHKLFEYTKESSYTEITAKQFKDENDWTYTLDVLADGEAKVAVSAKYNDKYQFFVGIGNQSDGTVTTPEELLKGGVKQHLHLVYDFKTDRLVSGWVPGGDISSDVILNADMLLARIGQNSADSIKINTAGAQIKEIKTIYAVLQLDRSKMLGETGIKADGHLYENAIYWFSLPFDVKVNDIFGVDGYGTKWVLQYYDGAKRAKIGFFAETETFWTYLGINDTIKANVGYAVCLDPDYFDSAEDEIWVNNRQSVCFYFPSTDKNLKIVGKDSITISVPAHECTIDRTFADGKKNHKITDTDWNVIGSPAFQNMTGTTKMKINSLYKWNPTDNTYEVKPVEGFTFQSTSAYLVQFHGDIKWEAASVITSTAAAPRYTYADEKNYTIELQFYYGSQWDRTYVALKDNANEDFVLNEDLTKMINAGQPNIYSYAGAYDVAYNGTAFKDQIVNLGVIARKNGSYTFAMPKDFSGSAILVDLESGEATDLNLSNYTIELNKGTYNNRFQLILKVEASTPTNIDNVDSREWSVDGKTKKLLINDKIYLINGGRVYNVLGAELR